MRPNHCADYFMAALFYALVLGTPAWIGYLVWMSFPWK